MKFSNLKTAYRHFLYDFFSSHCQITDLVLLFEKFLHEYSKRNGYDESFAEKLEENLIYLEMLNAKYDELFEYIENISFINLKVPKIKKRKNYAICRDDKDIFVNLKDGQIK